MIVEEKIKRMGLTMHEVGEPLSSYTYVKRVGSFLHLSGHGPFVGRENKQAYKGKVGREVTIAQAQEAARLVALNCLSSIKAAIGDLDKVRSIVRLTAYVNCVEGLEDYYKATDAASDLLIELYGEAGRHARMSIGVNQNPHSVPIALDMIVQIAD